MIWAGRSYEPGGRTRPGRRRFHAHERIPGNAHIAPYPRSYGLAALGPSSASSWSSSPPSNGSLNCIGFLYGAFSQSGLDGSGLVGGLAMSRSVSQPLADDAADRAFGAFYIVHAKSDPIAVPEIEFREVTVQVGFADMEIAANDAALQDREIAFGVIDVRLDAVRQLARPFLFAVVDRIVTGKAPPDAAIGMQLVSHQSAFGIDAAKDHAAKSRRSEVLDFVRTRPAAAFNESDDRHAITASAASPAVLGMQKPSWAAFLVDGIGLIRLGDFAFAPERTGAAFVHRQSDAMADKPAGFEVNAKNATELICREALFAGAHQVHCLEPNVHRHVTLLEDGSDLDGKWLPAGVALVDADPGALSIQLAAVADSAAMRANAPVRPNDRFDVGVGGWFVAEVGFVENGSRHLLSHFQRTYNA